MWLMIGKLQSMYLNNQVLHKQLPENKNFCIH